MSIRPKLRVYPSSGSVWVIVLFCSFVVSSSYLQGKNIIAVHDIQYGEAENDQNVVQPLLMDVYRFEQADESQSAIILVHGGGFGGGDKQQMLYIKMAQAFAEQGYVVFSINYRLKTKKEYSQAVFDQAFADALTALNFIKEHSSEYNIDTSKIIIAGDSAGGAIAVNAAYGDPGNSLVAGCIDMWGGMHPINPTYPHVPPWDQPIYSFPIAGSVPPTCIIHGTSDDIVPLSTSKTLAAELQSAGVYHELHILEGAEHYPEEFAEQFIPIMISFANKVTSGEE